jgi:hypothetical protein
MLAGMTEVEGVFSTLEQLGPRGVERMAESIDSAWIDEALVASGTASIRRRRLPAEQVIWLVLGMALFEDRAISAVVEHLGLALPGAGKLASSGVPQARSRVGPEPLKWLFGRTVQAWKTATDPGGYRDLTPYALDGTHLRVQDSDANYAHFGKPKMAAGAEGAYPQARLVCLLNVATRLIEAARFGPYATHERVLAEELFQELPERSVLLLDRGLFSYRVFAGMRVRGGDRHVLVRLKSNFECEELEPLADGSVRVLVRPSAKLKKAEPDILPALEGRVITYQNDGGEPGRFFTTLPEAYPAAELVTLYHDRWESEIAYDELKTHMLERRESLRSKTPAGVDQEVWGLLLAYNLVRYEMLKAAQALKMKAQRVSFWGALLVMRDFWRGAWSAAPGNVPKELAQMRASLAKLLLPPRRSSRRNPRHVKLIMSKFPANRRRSPKSIEGPKESPK